GGTVSPGFQLRITAGAGTIYYTATGADPRAVGGAIAAGAQTGGSPISLTLNSTAIVKARVFNSATSTWSALTEAKFIVGPLASEGNLVVSKIHYNPIGTSEGEE